MHAGQGWYWCLGLASLLASALMLASAAGVAACTPSPYDHAATTIIAEGWIERFAPRPDRSNGRSMFVPIDVFMRPQVALKGHVPDPLVFSDGASYAPNFRLDGQPSWSGSSGACGLFDADPTSRYAVIAFHANQAIASPGYVRLLVTGIGPNDSTIVRARQFVQGGVTPSADAPEIVRAPGTESEPSSEPSGTWGPSTPAMVALVVLAIVSGGLAGFAATGWTQVWLNRRRR